MKTNRITLITLAVEDVAVSRAFYEKLGWEAENFPDEKIVFFDMNGQKMGLYPRDALAKDIAKDVNTLKTGAMTLGQNFATTSEVDSAFDDAINAGASVISAPEEAFWGGYSCYIADPDGHLWEYAMNPFWALDADGNLA